MAAALRSRPVASPESTPAPRPAVHTPSPVLPTPTEPTRPNPPQPSHLEGERAALAALAGVQGMGLVVCPLPPLADEEPLWIPSGGISRPQFGADTVSGIVKEDAGRVTLNRDLPMPDEVPRGEASEEDIREEVRAQRRVPVAVLRWWDAWPGEMGTCVLEPVQNVVIRGKVVGPAGAPEAGSSVSACIEEAETDARGQFEIEAVVGVPCPIHVMSAAGQSFQGSTTLTPTGPNAQDITITLEARQPESRDKLEKGHASMDRYWLARIEELEQALATPGLDAEATHLLELWRQEQQDEREEQLLMGRQFIEAWEAWERSRGAR